VDRADPGSCPVADFGINSVETSECINRKLDQLLVSEQWSLSVDFAMFWSSLKFLSSI
jgi:hypothetical protein